MSYYYKYKFISPESVYSVVKEELKSYFDTGACDDLMFPTYVNKCLNKLGRSSYVITQELLYLTDFQSRLPDNFHAVREAWLCTETDATPYQTANSFYSQTMSTTIQIAPLIVAGSECPSTTCTDPLCTGCEELPSIIEAVYKTNTQLGRSFQQQYLLKPGNISARNSCDVDYTDLWDQYSSLPTNVANPKGSGYDSFDIRDNKFVTNFRNGAVYLIFYAIDYDEIGNQLIPDNYRIKEFIELFIKYKVFETLTNQTNDETFNQLQLKMQSYKQLADEAYIMAQMEIQKQTVDQKQRAIKRSLRRFRMYELPNRNNRSGWNRNV